MCISKIKMPFIFLCIYNPFKARIIVLFPKKTLPRRTSTTHGMTTDKSNMFWINNREITWNLRKSIQLFEC